MTANVTLSLKIDVSEIAARVDAMAEYLNVMDRDRLTPFGLRAMEVGEIDIAQCTAIEKTQGAYVLKAVGVLRELLDAFDAERGVAP